ncbi:SDR family NAD(P)-dependent oxidoreductase [Actinopolyspora mortivallis]|uniref:3-oxoacyl-ACP reductase n=1 Tax=Actinopolyspora mortivallis TaxID=33906 RepID=A0A2T0GTC4_ACTMO|nr:SDR family NAD(P)-dependent oxidoreductase [Actinopolyspora mortivallis]PRW62366.1 3-oxoacyl-ACP reductase [Actinopolyspora mortivallis]
MELHDKVAVVTGGTRGIGRGIVRRFRDEGAWVVFTGRDEVRGSQAEEELGADGQVRFVAADVRRRHEVEQAVDVAVERHGRLDVLVNNAGGAPSLRPVAEMEEATWHETIAVNLHSVYYATRRALAYLVPQESGRIITVSSFAGKAGIPCFGAYAAAKHAVIGLMRSLAQEVGPRGITANCVCPGIVVTDLVHQLGADLGLQTGTSYEQILDSFLEKTATGRTTTIEDVAALAVFLASDRGSGITGQALSVDGGMT